VARITHGFACSRSPMTSVRPEHWQHFAPRDQASNRLVDRHGQRVTYDQLLSTADPAIAGEMNLDGFRRIYDAGQRALDKLKTDLAAARPDVILFMGDDEDEIIHENNRPAILLYTGETCPIVPRAISDPNDVITREGNWSWGSKSGEYPVAADLCHALLRSLINEEFDVAHSSGFKSEKGMAHGFGFLYERLMPDPVIPIVPLILNVHWPPNQPTPRRFWKLGQAARRAVQQWPSDMRVAVIATGGLSVGRVDEELDRQLLDALRDHDVDSLDSLPHGWRQRSTGEVHAWMAAGGAAEHLQMDLIGYIPGYRSAAGTGCGLGFAEWR
jgi:Catalytic LigB subunit of aromatic ring-opening dioxygenase